MTHQDVTARARSLPRGVGAYAERVIAARGKSERLKRIVERSGMPMLIVDSERRYVEANIPARLAFRVTLAELRRLRINDLTPPERLGALDDAWTRLIETGCMAGPYEVASPDGSRLDIVYFALAEALPGQHLIAFMPAGWPERELLGEVDELDPGCDLGLTPREVEVLQLAADGRNGPMIAQELVLSHETVNTHFANIYTKLGVRDRAAAVARAMRLGLIA